MVTTVTLNPMLDKTIYIDRLQVGTIMRSRQAESAAGGKGINVSRQLKYLGVDTVASGFLGGEIGTIIEHLLQQESIKSDFVHIGDTTRIGVTILETSTGTSTAIFEPGHRVTADEIEQLKAKCQSFVHISDWMVLSGSVPCNGMDMLYKELIEMASGQNVKVALDTYHQPLLYGIEAQPFMIKPNVKESEETFSIRLRSERDVLAFIKQLREKEIPLIVITNGGHPAYVCFDNNIWRVIPPAVKPVNPVGSGDTMIAAMIFGFISHWQIEDVIRFGVAAGAANASVWRIAACHRQEIDALVPQVKLELLDSS